MDTKELESARKDFFNFVKRLLKIKGKPKIRVYGNAPIIGILNEEEITYSLSKLSVFQIRRTRDYSLYDSSNLKKSKVLEIRLLCGDPYYEKWVTLWKRFWGMED